MVLLHPRQCGHSLLPDAADLSSISDERGVFLLPAADRAQLSIYVVLG